MLYRKHTHPCLLKGLFFMLKDKEVALYPKGSHLEGMGGRDSDRRGCWYKVECGSFSYPLFLLSLLFSVSPPPKNLGMNTACHPLGGWGSTAVIKKLMPTFNKRWVQCVSGGNRRGRERRGWLRKLLDGGEGKKAWTYPQWQRGSWSCPYLSQHHPLPSSSPPS